MKVLLAEDNPDSRRLVKVHLSAAGYEVIEAEDGQLAWELFQRDTFQIVITDWMMPKMDGPTLIHNIRSNGQKSYTYIIMLTAIDDKPKVVIGLEAGADEYLTKPFDSRELIARVASGERILKLEEQLPQARHEMETLAMHDGLTGMFNRRAIEEYTEAELDLARRKERPLASYYWILIISRLSTISLDIRSVTTHCNNWQGSFPGTCANMIASDDGEATSLL